MTTFRNLSFLSFLAVLLAGLVASGASGSGESGGDFGALPQDSCPVIYDGDNGWVIDQCASDPQIESPMEIYLDGVFQGEAAMLRVYHQSQAWPGTPQVAVIYASGYVRLKHNADPPKGIPFGTSFILGPAYWPDTSTYYHNPQLDRFEIDTSRLPNSPLVMQATGTNHDFAVAYELLMPPPRDRQTRLHVTQTFTATATINIDPTRQAEFQGLKLVQASSMYINEGETCDGGNEDCHDSDAVRTIGSNLARQQVAFRDVAPDHLIFAEPVSLGSTWLDVLHSDDDSWQGNTPNARMALDALPEIYTVTPQGWIGVTSDPNNDNVSLWFQAGGADMDSWPAGRSERVGYWLLAQDNPPDPWQDLGLRPGLSLLDFEGDYDCYPVVMDSHTTGVVAPIGGYVDTALELAYDLGSDDGNWSQLRCDFDTPLDLSAYDHLRLDWRGDPQAANSLQIALVDQYDSTQRIWARGTHHVTQHGWWGQLVVPFDFLDPWHGGIFDPSQVVGFFVSVVKDGEEDAGGAGSLAVDNLSAFNLTDRAVPADFSEPVPSAWGAEAAVGWIASQQKASGLLKSWQEEPGCTAHIYDQALALIVLSRAGRWAEADALVAGLAQAQNPDGSWYKSYDCSDSAPACVHCHLWEGDIAWAIYALGRYRALGGTNPVAGITLCRATQWMAGQVDPANGCLLIEHTEGTLDAWWAFQAAGTQAEADGIRDCLLDNYWDETMGRFLGGFDWHQPYLDNQTWGSAFLQAIGREEDARRALSYARGTLLLPAQGGQLFGFDGQGGPWSLWNEGTGQYIAAGGGDAGDLVLELLAQQRADGAVPGSPDAFAGGGVWTTRWHGLAPTAWLYMALQSEPFHPGAGATCGCIYLPLVTRDP